MTITIELPADVEASALRRADRDGLPLPQYLVSLVQDGLRRQEQDEQKSTRLGNIRREVALGVEQVREKGEYTVYTSPEALAEAVNKRGRERLSKQTNAE